MEEEPDASESDAPELESYPEPSPARTDLVRPASVRALAPSHIRRPWPLSLLAGRYLLGFVLLAAAAIVAPTLVRADGLDTGRKSGRLVYGGDMEGGGPYIYPDLKAPGGLAGFEVELMQRLAGDLGVKPVFSQGQWDKLLQI